MYKIFHTILPRIFIFIFLNNYVYKREDTVHRFKKHFAQLVNCMHLISSLNITTSECFQEQFAAPIRTTVTEDIIS